MCVCVWMDVCICAWMDVCVCVCACVCVCVDVCAHVCMCVDVHVCTIVWIYVGRKNSSTLDSFPGSHQAWNNAVLTSMTESGLGTSCKITEQKTVD